MNKSLHWTQRVALVRHNLHAASRSGDFTFFKTLQAQGLVDNTNHVATLSATLGDEADLVLAGLDDLNASMAQIHEDAFKNVYNSLKTYLGETGMDEGGYDEKSKLYVDSNMQKQMADHAIDKTTSSAVALIQQQPSTVQDTAANVWITGNTIIADSIEICLLQINALETNAHDFIRLEESWNTVKASVGHSVSALKGVFTLMTPEDCETSSNAPSSRTPSFSGSMFRRLSNAFGTNNAAYSNNGYPTSLPSRSSSLSLHLPSRSATATPEYRTPNYLRNSVSSACPTSLQGFKHTRLDAIPPTPAAAVTMDDEVNPFDTSVLGCDVPEVPQLNMSDGRVSQAVMCLL